MWQICFKLADIITYWHTEQGNSLSEKCLGHCEVSKMKLFAKMNNGFKSLTLFIKSSMLYVCLLSEYTSALCDITLQKIP